MSLQKFCRVKYCNRPYDHITSFHKCVKCNNSGHGIFECGDEKLIKNLNYLKDIPLPHSKKCKIKNCSIQWTHISSEHICGYKNCDGNHSIFKCPKIVNVIKPLKIMCPICRTINIIQDNQKKVYGIEEKCKICITNNIEIYLPECGHTCMCEKCAKLLNKNINENIMEEEELLANIKDSAIIFMNNCNGKIYTIVKADEGDQFYIKRDGITKKLLTFYMSSGSWGQYGDSFDDRGDLYRFIDGYRYVNINEGSIYI